MAIVVMNLWLCFSIILKKDGFKAKYVNFILIEEKINLTFSVNFYLVKS